MGAGQLGAKRRIGGRRTKERGLRKMDAGIDAKRYKREFSGLGMRMALCAVAIYGVQMLAQLAVGFGLAERLDLDLTDMNVLLAITMIPMYVIGFPLAFLIMRKGGDKRVIEKRRMRPGQFLIAFVMGYVLLMAGNLIGMALTFAIGILKGNPVNNSLVDIVSDTNIWVTAIYTVILAPIFEELLCRKMICDRVVKYGQGTAVLLSGLLFGLFHGNFNQFFYAFFIGCFFAFVYVKTGNVKYTIGLHMIVNFFGSVVGGLLLQSIDIEHLTLDAVTPSTIIIVALYMLVIYGILIAGVVLLLLNRSKFKLDAGEVALDRRTRNRVVFGNAGMIVCCALFFVMMIAQAVFG